MKRSKKAETDDHQKRNDALLKMRFEATIFPGRKAEKNWADDLNVDRDCPIAI